MKIQEKRMGCLPTGGIINLSLSLSLSLSIYIYIYERMRGTHSSEKIKQKPK